ncbi:MAG: thioredoxin-disulfide reductase [Candidatus Levybacteria bacterium RIFCSPHIGHO2_01_FULL_38_26]|nr:MAG: thioredoxin-disulfide reductase [Candidatus Levybacteria bacterium RIFCSPHIGHO2_01_FULL_38_26]
MYDVIVIGSGPAGLTAAIYTTRANLKTLVIAGVKWGGQLMLTTLVENYPGFPEGIQGPDLMMAMRKQAEHHGAEIVDADFTSADFSKRPFSITAGDKTYEGKSVIIATGADTKWLGVPGEKEKIGRGVSSCAPCDAPFFREKNVVVAGGGDSAMEEALVLTKFANSVTVIHRRDEFKASKIMLDRARKNPKIKFVTNTEIVEVLGQDKVEKVKLKNNQTNEVTDLPVDGVFVAIGHMPNTLVFSAKGPLRSEASGSAFGRKDIELDEQGFIKVHDHTRTNQEGVFVAGDVHDARYKQAVTAAGFGCMAALEAEKWLENQS